MNRPLTTLAVTLAVTIAVLPAAAGADPVGTPATAAIAGGNLGLAAPGTVAFTATLRGVDQTVTDHQQLDVSDATGAGGGWSITATSTTFTTGGATPRTLPAGAVTVQATPRVACAAGSSCAVADPDTGLYPYTLPSAGIAPTATTLYRAGASSGLGDQAIDATMTLRLPGDTRPGSYTSTWTYTISTPI